MPLWRIYSHPTTFTPTQRSALAQSVTRLYSPHMPAFYVNVIFIDADADALFIGGEPTTTFVRVTVEQIALKLPDGDTDEGAGRRRWWMDRVNETLQPHIQARPELDWELHIVETPRDLWRINGIDPPPFKSEAEKMWKVQGRAVPYDDVDKGDQKKKRNESL